MSYALPGTPLDINQKTKVLWQSALHTGKYGTSIVWFLIYESKFTTIIIIMGIYNFEVARGPVPVAKLGSLESR